jgi:hypothetical protein
MQRKGKRLKKNELFEELLWNERLATAPILPRHGEKKAIKLIVNIGFSTTLKPKT